MAIQAQKIKLNMVPGGIIPVVHLSQNDIGRVLQFELYDGVSAASITTGTTVTVEGTKPDRHAFQYDATISGNVVTVNTVQQMVIVPGTVECTLTLTYSGQVIGTALFFMEVERSGIADNTDISETVLPVYMEAGRQYMLGSEAWAVGTKNGEPVGSVEPQYNNYSKYYADRAHEDAVISGSAMLIAGQSAESARESAVISGSAMRIAGQSAATAQSAAADALGYKSQASESAAQAAASAIQSAASAATSADAEAWAVGERAGQPVDPGDPTFHNNAKYYAGQAEDAVSYGIVDMVGATATTNGKHGAAHEPVAGQENYYWRGDATWSREDMTVTEITDSAPYLYRASKGGDRQYDELIGGSVVFNQLVNTSDTTCTVPNGHKYIFKHNTTYTVAISDGNAFSVDGSANDNVHDITKMFGSTIADYIYAREIAETGSGIAWIKSYGFFSKDYYAYDTGSILSVNTSGHKLGGKNFIDLTDKCVSSTSDKHGLNIQYNKDKSIRIYGNLNISSGNTAFKFAGMPNNLYPGNYILSLGLNVTGGTDVYLTTSNSSQGSVYRKLGTISVGSSTLTFTVTDSDITTYGYFYINLRVGYTSATINNIYYPMLRLASVADATYQPYKDPTTYPLTSTDLRGILSLSGDDLVYDGDVYESDGTETVKYALLSNQTGAIGDTITLTGYKTSGKIICDKGLISDIGTISGTTLTLTTAITSASFVYELATPTTATLSPFVSPQICDKDGTEEYIDTRAVPMPVGHHTEYYGVPEWLRDRYLDELRELPYKITPISNGGTGLSSSPSMLTNLGSTSADDILKASPRPGVTGTLPIENGGTGATTVSGARKSLGLGDNSGNLPITIAQGGTGCTTSGKYNQATGFLAITTIETAKKDFAANTNDWFADTAISLSGYQAVGIIGIEIWSDTSGSTYANASISNYYMRLPFTSGSKIKLAIKNLGTSSQKLYARVHVLWVKSIES